MPVLRCGGRWNGGTKIKTERQKNHNKGEKTTFIFDLKDTKKF